MYGSGAATAFLHRVMDLSRAIASDVWSAPHAGGPQCRGCRSKVTSGSISLTTKGFDQKQATVTWPQRSKVISGSISL